MYNILRAWESISSRSILQKSSDEVRDETSSPMIIREKTLIPRQRAKAIVICIEKMIYYRIENYRIEIS